MRVHWRRMWIGCVVLGLLSGVLACKTSHLRSMESVVSEGSVNDAGGGRLYALLIGIDQYAGGIRPLRYAVRDAEAIREVLMRSNGMTETQAAGQIRLLVNEQATKVGIKESFRWLRGRAGAKDTAVIFFAGHGKDKDRVSYWVSADTTATTNLDEKGFSHEELNSEIGYLKTEKVLVFVDACHSGFGMRGMRGEDKPLESFRFQGKGRVILSSSRQSQESGEDDSLQHGFFTYALLEAWKGKADVDGDGRVDLLETYRYLQKRVPALAWEKKKHKQQPVMHGTLSGEVLLARTQRREESGGGGTVAEGERGRVGRLRVESMPSGATVYIDGTNEGKTPWEGDVPKGRRQVEVRQEGYTSAKEQVRVHARQRRVLAYTLRSANAAETPSITVTSAQSTQGSTPSAGDRKTFTAEGVAFAMRWIPAGSFAMGSPSNEAGRDSDEGPQRRVQISKGFWMLETEVTQAQWKGLMGEGVKPHFKNCGENCPMESVSWHEARAFANKLSESEGLAACTATNRGIFGCKGWRLPTEAEWEYAARAGTSTAFHTGRCLSTDEANYDGNYPQRGCSKGEYREKTIEVCSLARNAWGLCDMHGNVCEWTMDVKGSYGGLGTQDPLRSSGSAGRVFRGGAWISSAGLVRSAARFSVAPTVRSSSLGFRLLRY